MRLPNLATSAERVLEDGLLCHLLFTPNKITSKIAGTLSFSRAGEATYFDLYGILRTAAINELRIEKDGALIEGASTNYITESSDVTSPSYITSGNVSLTRETTTSIRGVDELVSKAETTAAGAASYYGTQASSPTPTANTINTFSMLVKRDTSQKVTIQANIAGDSISYGLATFDFDTETIVAAGGSVASCRAVKRGYGWYSLSVSVLVDPSSASGFFINQVFCFPSSSDTASAGSVFVDGHQFEQLMHETSYIPTSGAPATRAADLFDVQFANNHPLFSSSNTLVLNCLYGFNVNGNSDSCTIFDVSNNIDANLVYDKAAQELTSKYFVAGNSVSAIDSSSYPVELACGRVVDWDSKAHTAFCNGVYGNIQDITNGIPVNVNGATNINLGRDQYNAGSHARIHIKSLKIYDKALTSNQLSFLTGY